MKTWHYVISEKCNLKCLYCNVDVNNNLRLDERAFDIFYKKILSSNERYILSLFGGEPFLQLDIIEYIISRIKDDVNLISIPITTNGTIYNEQVKRILKCNKIKCTISYDGILQEYNRGTTKLKRMMNI